MLHGKGGIRKSFTKGTGLKQKSLPSGRLFGEWCNGQEDRGAVMFGAD